MPVALKSRIAWAMPVALSFSLRIRIVCIVFFYAPLHLRQQYFFNEIL